MELIRREKMRKIRLAIISVFLVLFAIAGAIVGVYAFTPDGGPIAEFSVGYSVGEKVAVGFGGTYRSADDLTAPLWFSSDKNTNENNLFVSSKPEEGLTLKLHKDENGVAKLSETCVASFYIENLGFRTIHAEFKDCAIKQNLKISYVCGSIEQTGGWLTSGRQQMFLDKDLAYMFEVLPGEIYCIQIEMWPKNKEQSAHYESLATSGLGITFNFHAA